MKFHTFGNKNNKTVILIHGVLTPWQIWEKQIDVLKEKFYVVVPALDGHIEDSASEYISVENEAEQIESYVIKELNGKVFTLCGLSMGGVIAFKIFERSNLDIDFLVLDGAPLIKNSLLSEKVMSNAYKSIIHKSKKRDKKTLENFKKDFLPEKYLSSYLKIADTMSDKTVENMIHSVCASKFVPCVNKNNTGILFLHGTKGNEVYSVKTARLMKKHFPDMAVKSFDGYKHAELAIYKPEEWLEAVTSFISKR